MLTLWSRASRRAETLAIATLASAVVTSCAPPTTPTTTFTLLQANVGNALLSCGDDYVYKLCDVDVEQRIADHIAALGPDVVFLQEVVPDALCDAFVEDDPTRTCFADHRSREPSQVRRLLGPAYDVSCDVRNGYECIGTRTSSTIAVLSSYETAPVPGVDLDGAGCDPGFTVGAQTLSIAGRTVRVVNAHPNSTVPACRAAQVRQIFEGSADLAPLIGDDVAIVSGDMNLDPFSNGLNADDESVDVWSAHVGDAQDFAYASGPAERDPPYPTSTTLLDQTLDHVAVRGLRGTCVTLGEADGTERLDGGEGCDHRALSCTLTVDDATP